MTTRKRPARHDRPISDTTSTVEFSPVPARLRSYEDAALHLLSHGLTPAPNVAAMRLMFKAGGESRRVAELIAERWDLVS